MKDQDIRRLKTLRLALSDAPLRFEKENRPAIEAHWAAAVAANPRLWNGPSFMFEDVRLEGGKLTGTGHRTDFATFLHWRDNGRPAGVVHITGTSLPVTRDGALFAVRMAQHTANPGAIYFPAGSFDAADVIDGMFDVTRNIARELAEETGLGFHEADAEASLTAVFDRGAIHITRRNLLAADFAGCAARLNRHQAETGDDEVDGAIAIRRGDGSLRALKPYAKALAEWHFENAAFSCTGDV
ncbi:hypothetical protein [Oricola nitratireducens]|uniref:hypothetical protein n=1 Tax=Oricola nitratireducens TaxID=2775868 RepID=UPI0018679548|nr:hypothetical protein [Oricola nitratireducens]